MSVPEPPAAARGRRVVLTRASSIEVRPVQWLWADRIPLGALTLCAGREGTGKSTFCYALAAALTKGRLRGAYLHRPRGVLVAATEDSWAHTIAPRLMAAGADLDRVFRVDVEDDVTNDVLVLPRDLDDLEHHIRDQDVGMVLLDPLVSRLSGTLDTHKDADVRQALEPLTALADRTGAAVVGLAHVNKSLSTDPMNQIIGSRAFTAVARAVVFVARDPEDNARRLVGVPKSNLGRTDLPTLMFDIEATTVAETDEGPVTTGRLVWTGETPRTLVEILEGGDDKPRHKSAVGAATTWLKTFLTDQGGAAERSAVEQAGKAAGHGLDALKRARQPLGVETVNHGFPRQTYWALPARGDAQTSVQSEQISPVSQHAPTAPTEATSATPMLRPTGAIAEHAQQWAQLEQSDSTAESAA